MLYKSTHSEQIKVNNMFQNNNYKNYLEIPFVFKIRGFYSLVRKGFIITILIINQNLSNKCVVIFHIMKIMQNKIVNINRIRKL